MSECCGTCKHGKPGKEQLVIEGHGSFRIHRYCEIFDRLHHHFDWCTEYEPKPARKRKASSEKEESK